MPLPITVSELHTDDSESNVGKNTIIIAMTRYEAGFLEDILRHYAKTNETTEYTGRLCRELLDRMDDCFGVKWTDPKGLNRDKINAAALEIDKPDSDFFAPRTCFRDPIPEIFHAAGLLDRAVDAHLAGDRAQAARLIADADMPEVREWVESIWGRESRDIHRVREVEGSPPKLGRDDRRRDPRRDATCDQKRALVERDGFRCGFCGIPVVRTEIRRAMHLEYPQALPWGGTNAGQHAAFQCLWMQFDHVLPHSRGGRTDLDNLVVTCGPCNYGRSEATLDEVGLVDPRTRPVPGTEWDGLERFLG